MFLGKTLDRLKPAMQRVALQALLFLFSLLLFFKLGLIYTDAFLRMVLGSCPSSRFYLFGLVRFELISSIRIKVKQFHLAGYAL